MEKNYLLVKKQNSNLFLITAHYDVEKACFVGEFTTDENQALHFYHRSTAEWYCYMVNSIKADELCNIVSAPRFTNLNEAYYL